MHINIIEISNTKNYNYVSIYLFIPITLIEPAGIINKTTKIVIEILIKLSLKKFILIIWYALGIKIIWTLKNEMRMKIFKIIIFEMSFTNSGV